MSRLVLLVLCILNWSGVAESTIMHDELQSVGYHLPFEHGSPNLICKLCFTCICFYVILTVPMIIAGECQVNKYRSDIKKGKKKKRKDIKKRSGIQETSLESDKDQPAISLSYVQDHKDGTDEDMHKETETQNNLSYLKNKLERVPEIYMPSILANSYSLSSLKTGTCHKSFIDDFYALNQECPCPEVTQPKQLIRTGTSDSKHTKTINYYEDTDLFFEGTIEDKEECKLNLLESNFDGDQTCLKALQKEIKKVDETLVSVSSGYSGYPKGSTYSNELGQSSATICSSSSRADDKIGYDCSFSRTANCSFSSNSHSNFRKIPCENSISEKSLESFDNISPIVSSCFNFSESDVEGAKDRKDEIRNIDEVFKNGNITRKLGENNDSLPAVIDDNQKLFSDKNLQSKSGNIKNTNHVNDFDNTFAETSSAEVEVEYYDNRGESNLEDILALKTKKSSRNCCFPIVLFNEDIPKDKMEKKEREKKILHHLQTLYKYFNLALYGNDIWINHFITKVDVRWPLCENEENKEECLEHVQEKNQDEPAVLSIDSGYMSYEVESNQKAGTINNRKNLSQQKNEIENCSLDSGYGGSMNMPVESKDQMSLPEELKKSCAFQDVRKSDQMTCSTPQPKPDLSQNLDAPFSQTGGLDDSAIPVASVSVESPMPQSGNDKKASKIRKTGESSYQNETKTGDLIDVCLAMSHHTVISVQQVSRTQSLEWDSRENSKRENNFPDAKKSGRAISTSRLGKCGMLNNYEHENYYYCKTNEPDSLESLTSSTESIYKTETHSFVNDTNMGHTETFYMEAVADEQLKCQESQLSTECQAIEHFTREVSEAKTKIVEAKSKDQSCNTVFDRNLEETADGTRDTGICNTNEPKPDLENSLLIDEKIIEASKKLDLIDSPIQSDDKNENNFTLIRDASIEKCIGSETVVIQIVQLCDNGRLGNESLVDQNMQGDPFATVDEKGQTLEGHCLIKDSLENCRKTGHKIKEHRKRKRRRRKKKTDPQSSVKVAVDAFSYDVEDDVDIVDIETDKVCMFSSRKTERYTELLESSKNNLREFTRLNEKISKEITRNVARKIKLERKIPGQPENLCFIKKQKKRIDFCRRCHRNVLLSDSTCKSNCHVAFGNTSIIDVRGESDQEYALEIKKSLDSGFASVELLTSHVMSEMEEFKEMIKKEKDKITFQKTAEESFMYLEGMIKKELKKKWMEQLYHPLGFRPANTDGNVYPAGLQGYFQRLEQGPMSQEESLSYEWLRLHSLRNYQGNGSIIQLSRHGFYHDEEHGPNATRCYCCNVMYSDWNYFDNIQEVHRRLSPNCPLLNANEEISQTNIPADAEQSQSSLQTREGPEENRNLPVNNSNRESSVENVTASLEDTHIGGRNMVPEGFPSQPTEDRDNAEFSRATPSIAGGPQAIGALPRNVQTTTHGMASLTSQTDINNTATGARSNESTGEKRTVTSQPSNPQSRPPSYTPAIGGAGKLREINQGNGGFSMPGDEIVYGVGDPRLVHVEHPKHQNYRTIQSRSSSFTSLWPSYLDQTPRQMAEAGFFYAGVADFTRCFACGGGLRNWEAGDDPCLEHTRWYPRCEYMNKLKGTRYVEAVTRRQEQHMADQRRRQQQLQQQRQQMQNQSNNTPSDPLSTPAAATLLEMGYTRERIREAFTAVQRNTGHNSVNAEQALLWILDQDERESQRQTNSTSSQSSTTGATASVSASASSTASGGSSRASPNSTTRTASPASASGGSSSVSNSTASAAASVGSSSTSSTNTTTSVSSASTSATGTSSQGQKLQGQGGSAKGSGKKNDDKKKDDKGGEKNEGKDSQKKGAEGEQPASGKKKKNGKKKGKGGGANGLLGGAPGGVGGATGGKGGESSNKEEEKPESQSEVASMDTQSLKEENQKLREMQTCKICMDKPVNMTLLPCGHLVCCENCVPHLRKCPICRKRIEGSVKTYMS